MEEKNKTLKNFAEEIVNRFPAGRENASLMHTPGPDIERVKEILTIIVEGKDQDRRYIDEKSKKDAKNLLERLEEWQKLINPSDIRFKIKIGSLLNVL